MTKIDQPLWHWLSVSPFGSTILRFKASLVEFNSEFCFFSFPYKERQKNSQDLNACGAPTMSYIKKSVFDRVFSVPRSVEMNFQSEGVTEELNRSRISHLQTERENVTGCFSSMPGYDGSFDGDAAFPVDQSGKVSQFPFVDLHVTSVSCLPYFSKHERRYESPEKKSANSVDILPGNAGDNTEPSIIFKDEGVCREHGLTPKGMICSELCSNVQSAAEMTAPLALARGNRLQDARTAHILWLGALGVSNRRKNGILYSIATTTAS